jgi:hypothetical protein
MLEEFHSKFDLGTQYSSFLELVSKRLSLPELVVVKPVIPAAKKTTVVLEQK